MVGLAGFLAGNAPTLAESIGSPLLQLGTLGALFLDAMGVQRKGLLPAAADYSLGALLAWSKGVTGGAAACVRTAPLRLICGPHLLALLLIGLALRLLAHTLLAADARGRHRQPALCWGGRRTAKADAPPGAAPVGAPRAGLPRHAGRGLSMV
ncbi:hypothetical protein T492DRAFT_888012 [Pavlovales sp. CCMP2436]|nr:hypothetical protein T492DRAFT_888012 [Pavlovales sp. CCMP2436]